MRRLPATLIDRRCRIRSAEILFHCRRRYPFDQTLVGQGDNGVLGRRERRLTRHRGVSDKHAGGPFADTSKLRTHFFSPRNSLTRNAELGISLIRFLAAPASGA